jgi:hypothetical protein
LIADSVGPWTFSLVVGLVFALLVFWLVRDRTSALRFGIFLEHQRKERRSPSTEETKIMWPGERGDVEGGSA